MLKKAFKTLGIFILVLAWLLIGWPGVWITPQFQFPPKIGFVKAATNTETITASQTWTAPAGVTSVSAECWGSGGQGGGSTTNTLGGTGGGAGAYAKTASVAVTPGTGYTLTVGALVTNGAGLGGGTGGDTSFTGDSTQKCLAKGGVGGAINGGTAGTGGLASASTGDAVTKFDGGGGWKNTSTSGGGGGSSGGTAAAGNTATSVTGAAAVSGGGNGGNGGATVKPNDGNAPTTSPGGGGGGGGCKSKTTGCSTSGTNTTGGAGKIGQVNLTYTVYTVLGNGTDGGNTSIGPGGPATEIDRFSFVDSVGTDTVTGLTVTLASDANAYTNVATVDVQTTGSVSKCSTSSITSDSVTLSSCAIAVTTTLTQYKVMVTPKTHANMPAPPGASYATTATVTNWTGTNTHGTTTSDSGSATVTIDNASPNGATSTSGTAGTATNTLNWTTSNSSDFATTNGSVVLRWAAASAGNAVPAEGTTSYTAGNTIVGGDSQTATVACVISSAASTALSKIDGTGGSTGCTTSALTNGQAYTYKVFQVDTNGNYDVGVSIGTFTPALISISITSDGSVAYGIVAASATKDTTASGLNDTQTVKNDGSGPETFTIKTSNATGGTTWTLGSSPAANVFVHEYSINGGSSWIKFITADSPQAFLSNVAANGTQNFDLRLTAPSSTSDYQQKSITVTVLATQYP